jgi:hypothetical protein
MVLYVCQVNPGLIGEFACHERVKRTCVKQAKRRPPRQVARQAHVEHRTRVGRAHAIRDDNAVEAHAWEVNVSRYGREEQEWAALEEAGWEFLNAQARLERTTSYTEMNTVLARRTGVSEFDFDLDGERHAMGELLGQLSERSFAQVGLLISVLVQYLNANDAGPGFYDLAKRKRLLRPRASQDEKLIFWVGHVKAVHAHHW